MTKMWLEPADKIDLAQNGSQIFRKIFIFELPFSFFLALGSGHNNPCIDLHMHVHLYGVEAKKQLNDAETIFNQWPSIGCLYALQYWL